MASTGDVGVDPDVQLDAVLELVEATVDGFAGCLVMCLELQ